MRDDAPGTADPGDGVNLRSDAGVGVGVVHEELPLTWSLRWLLPLMAVTWYLGAGRRPFTKPVGVEI